MLSRIGVPKEVRGAVAEHEETLPTSIREQVKAKIFFGSTSVFILEHWEAYAVSFRDASFVIRDVGDLVKELDKRGLIEPRKPVRVLYVEYLGRSILRDTLPHIGFVIGLLGGYSISINMLCAAMAVTIYALLTFVAFLGERAKACLIMRRHRFTWW